MSETAQTTTSIIESTVKQTGEALNSVFAEVFKYALVLFVVAMLFLVIKFVIVKAFKKKSAQSGKTIKATPVSKNNNEQMYYLEKDQLEVIRIFDKLSDEDKAEFKAKMYQAVKDKKLKI